MSWSSVFPYGFLIIGKFSAFCHTGCHCLSGSRPILMKSRIVATAKTLSASEKKTSWKLRFYCSKFPNVVQVTNAFSYSLETYFIAGVAIRKRDETRPDEERHLQRIQCGRTPNNFQICKEYIDTRKKVCTTVAALTQLHPSFQINWKMLLSGLFPQPPQPHDVLIVHNPTYLRKLGRIIALFGKR